MRTGRNGLPLAWEHVYDGWELFDSDPREAKRCFERAIAEDPDVADAYNGLAELAKVRNNWRAAEKYYLTAHEKAKAFLGTEDEQAFAWWGELDTRPYMRSRHGLALLYYTVGRYVEAIALLEDLLRRNPNDNQGARYLVASAHLLNDDLPGALEAYARFERDYPGDVPDPQFLLNWSLASFMAGRYEAAAVRFRATIFSNPYLLPLVLNRKPKVLPIWHSNNLMRLDYALEYFDLHETLWAGRDDARDFVQFLLEDVEIRGDFERWVILWTEITDLDASARRTALLEKTYLIESRKLSRAFKLRMQAFLAAAARQE